MRKAETRLNREDQRGTDRAKCSRCGTFHTPRKYEQRCTKCHQLNHYAIIRKDTFGSHQARRHSNGDSSKSWKKLLGTLQFAVKKGRVALQCQLDTAASCNVLSLKDHRKLGEPPQEKSVTTLTMYDVYLANTTSTWTKRCCQSKTGHTRFRVP